MNDHDLSGSNPERASTLYLHEGYKESTQSSHSLKCPAVMIIPGDTITSSYTTRRESPGKTHRLTGEQMKQLLKLYKHCEMEI